MADEHVDISLQYRLRRFFEVTRKGCHVPVKPSALPKFLFSIAAILLFGCSSQGIAAEKNLRLPTNDVLDIRSLTSSSRHCISFQWVADGGTPRAAITIPVVLAGKALRFQLDTGSPGAILYVGNGGKGVNTERHADIELGDVRFVKTPLTEDTTQSIGSDGIAGTFGLAPLIGRITIIDYPAQRICIFNDANQPKYSNQVHWINGAITEQKFLLPASVGARRTRRAIFDTGSSTITLQLGLQDYLYATGLTDLSSSSESEGVNAWGSTVHSFGNKSRFDISLGNYPLGKPTVFQNTAFPNYSIVDDTRFTGVFGNKLLWDKIIILDLTQRARLGILE